MSDLKLKYEPVSRLTRDQIERDLRRDNPKAVAEALYSASRYEEDVEWVERQCLDRLKSSAVSIRHAAATCLGDLALGRRPLNTKLVIPALETAVEDSEIADAASFSLSMVKEFLERN